MKPNKIITAVCLLAGASILPVTSSAQAQAAPSVAGDVGQIERTSQLLGQNIKNSQGQSLGKISNVIVDLNAGRILYVVVDAAGGKSGDRFGIPGDKFSTSNRSQPVANVTTDQLAKAPRFAGGESVISSAEYAQQVYSYFGSRMWWGGGANVSFGSSAHDVKQLGTAQVSSSSGQPLGQVKDVVLDLVADRVLYVIMAPVGGASGTLYPIPPMAFTPGQNGSLVTGLTAASLQGAPSIPANQWPDVANPTYAQRVYQFYGKQAYFQRGQPASTPSR